MQLVFFVRFEDGRVSPAPRQSVITILRSKIVLDIAVDIAVCVYNDGFFSFMAIMKASD